MGIARRTSSKATFWYLSISSYGNRSKEDQNLPFAHEFKNLTGNLKVNGEKWAAHCADKAAKAQATPGVAGTI